MEYFISAKIENILTTISIEKINVFLQKNKKRY